MKTPHKKGIVYVLSNKAFPDKNGEKILKIGRTTDLLFRLRVLNIGVPDDYKVEYALQLDADQYVLAETFLHQLFQHKNEKREFYRIDLKTAISKMEQMRVLTKGVNVTSLYQTGHETSTGKVKAVKTPIELDPETQHKEGKKGITKSHIAPKTGLCVYLPDGSFIQEKKACDTFCKAIQVAGVMNVRNLGYVWCHVPLVSNTIDAKYGRAQHPVGNGLYALTHSSTADKKKQLDRISKALHLNWKVVIVD